MGPALPPQLFIFMTGVFVSSWIGGVLLSVGEWLIKKLPLVKHIYSAAKQVCLSHSDAPYITNELYLVRRYMLVESSVFWWALVLCSGGYCDRNRSTTLQLSSCGSQVTAGLNPENAEAKSFREYAPRL